MRGFVGTTDFDWFRFLRSRQPLDEVNFWQPSAHGFRAPAGTPFFFKLKAPHNAIGGFGIFARYDESTIRVAWDAFGEKNGAPSFIEMRRRVSSYASTNDAAHRVGCVMVSSPLFFDEADWIAQPRDWKRNVVSGAGYELDVGEGRRIWEACLERSRRLHTALPLVGEVDAPSDASRFGTPRLVAPRLGQATFRVGVTAAYASSCAITGEHSLPVLEAAHIRPYALDGSHEVTNGLLLRADIHRLFDQGYVTVTPELRFVVSDRLAAEFENGRAYYKRHGTEVRVPSKLRDRPHADYLRWHNDNVFERGAA